MVGSSNNGLIKTNFSYCKLKYNGVYWERLV